MGKKRVVTKSGEDLSKIEEKISTSQAKAPNVQLEKGRIYITASYNNTMVSVTDLSGRVIAWSSAGLLGFKGPKKATPFAASKVVEAVLEQVKKSGLKTVEIYVKGVGGGRDSAMRTIASHGLDIDLIKDVTPLPHNGPRPPKVRRV
ncbi:MAG: small subunit ribosomal protein [Patescibacteria group bacterium]|nr:small subunit ribosomal protein [Patescibacteria group bacterium]